jgi:hypothetical protein
MQNLQDRVEEVESYRLVFLLGRKLSKRIQNLQEGFFEKTVVSQLSTLSEENLKSLHV